MLIGCLLGVWLSMLGIGSETLGYEVFFVNVLNDLSGSCRPELTLAFGCNMRFLD